MSCIYMFMVFVCDITFSVVKHIEHCDICAIQINYYYYYYYYASMF